MPDGRKIHMDRLATHLRIFLHEKDGSFEEIKVNVRHNDNIYYETSKDSRYVLIQTSATTKSVAGCVFDLKKKEIVNGFDVLQDNPSIRPILGPFGSVVNATTKKNLLLNYRGGALSIKMPMVGVIEGIASDEERRIYVKTDVAVWMVSIESDTLSHSSIKLFDALDSRINPTFKIVNLTPSIICTKVDHVFYVYDLLKMELIHKRDQRTTFRTNQVVPIRDNFAVSPDGKLLFQHNAEQFHKTGVNHMIFISPFQAPVESLMIDNVPGELVCSDKGSRGHSHDYRPETPLVMLRFTWYPGNPMTKDVCSVSMDGTTLYAKNDYSTFGIVFKHPLPHPVFERKQEDLTWIRVMSDGALETHRTWPESIIESEEMGREVRETGFESEFLNIAAHVAFPRSGRATRMYIERLIHIIARALRE